MNVLGADDRFFDVVRRQWPQAAEHAHLRVALHVGVKRIRGLHRRQAEHLQYVVLHHVAQCADPFVVADAAASHFARLAVVLREPLFLGHGDLHVVDVLVVPQRLENAVGKPQHQQVLHGLLAQIMVDAVGLMFVEARAHGGVHRPGTFQVAADRLLDDHARERTLLVGRGDHARLLQVLHAHRHQARRNREVKHPAGRNAKLLIDRLQRSLSWA